MKKILVFLLNIFFIILLIFSIYYFKNNYKIDDKKEENLVIKENNEFNNDVDEPGTNDIFIVPFYPKKFVFNNYIYIIKLMKKI